MPLSVVETKPFFSIVMNVYNGEGYVEAAINSVLAQDFDDWELIVWDDCSDDGTLSRCREFDDPRIRVFSSEERVNIGAARNAAIAQARGEWVAFLDQDDLWLSDKLSQQADVIRSDTTGELGIVYGRAMEMDSAGRTTNKDFDRWHEFSKLPEGRIFSELVRKPSFICLSSSCLLRTALESVLPVPDYISHIPDYYLFVSISRNYTARAVESTCCWYRVHGESMSHVYSVAINSEVLALLDLYQQEIDPGVLSLRRKVHNSLIGYDGIRSGGGLRAGLSRILSQGSPLYLLSRPLVLQYRRFRRYFKRDFKFWILDVSRDLGLLGALDYLKYGLHRVALAPGNRAFRRENPDFRIPPQDLAFDAYNKVDWYEYRDLGQRHARVFADVFNREIPGDSIRVYEWGCGPARLIRHMEGLLRHEQVSLVGSDYNERSIEWCRDNVPGVEFLLNGLMPPVELADGSVDACYNFSVFTHLSQEVQEAWLAELWRVLRPGGVLVMTTHGQNYRHLLTKDADKQAYARGEVVIQGGYSEGKKWFLSIHPRDYVREVFLRDFVDIERLAIRSEDRILQDVWVARKPIELPIQAGG